MKAVEVERTRRVGSLLLVMLETRLTVHINSLLRFQKRRRRTFLITIVLPLFPQPQQSVYSGVLNISYVFVKNPGIVVMLSLSYIAPV